MKRLMSLPMSGRTLADYGGPAGLEAACRALGCDGMEVVWAGEDLPRDVPQALHTGYHLTFFPDWLDFWRGDRRALTEKFGSEAVWRAFYGGPEGPETLLKWYRADLDRAAAWGAEYVVFHVSDVSVREGYTYRWLHTSREVIDAALEAIGALLAGRAGGPAFLVENQWWPGFTFTDPDLTARLLEGIRYPNKGILLDTGHLMNADLDLETQEEGAAFLHRMLDRHGDLCRAVRGMHLHQSLSGAFVKAHTGALPEPWPEDYLEQYALAYDQVLQIDAHLPWTSPAIRSVVERVGPEWLVHELAAEGRGERDRAVRLQSRALGL